MFGSLCSLVGDVAKIATAPVRVAVDVAAAAVKPIAEVVEDVVDEAKDLLR